MVSDGWEIYQDDHLLSYVMSGPWGTPEINIIMCVNCNWKLKKACVYVHTYTCISIYT